MMETASPHDDQAPVDGKHLFKSNKRRRIARRRSNESEDVDEASYSAAPKSHEVDAETAERNGDGRGSTTGIIRVRRKAQRTGGLRATASPAAGVVSSALTLPSASTLDHEGKNIEQTAAQAAASRFTAQTGQAAASMDQHMIAYIDKKLSASYPANPEDPARESASTPATDSMQTLRAADTQMKAPATLGRLEEIDLHAFDAQRVASSTAPKNPKPTRERRKRDRRGEDDRERDALVDAILQESRLENMYDNVSSAKTNERAKGVNVLADQQLAEQFKKDFFNSVEERAAQHARAPPSSSKAAKGDSARGPKLGGSRSARAAMHAARMKQDQPSHK